MCHQTILIEIFWSFNILNSGEQSSEFEWVLNFTYLLVMRPTAPRSIGFQKCVYTWSGSMPYLIIKCSSNHTFVTFRFSRPQFSYFWISHVCVVHGDSSRVPFNSIYCHLLLFYNFITNLLHVVASNSSAFKITSGTYILYIKRKNFWHRLGVYTYPLAFPQQFQLCRIIDWRPSLIYMNNLKLFGLSTIRAPLPSQDLKSVYICANIGTEFVIYITRPSRRPVRP